MRSLTRKKNAGGVSRGGAEHAGPEDGRAHAETRRARRRRGMDLEVGCQIFDYWRGTLCRDLGTGVAKRRRRVSRGGAEIAEDGRRSEVSRNCPLNFASLRENLRRCSASRVPWSRRSVPLQFADGTSGVVARSASLGQDGACPSSLRSGPPVPLRNARPRVRTERAPPVFGVNFCLPPYFPPCLT